jgi:hypothetical protein
MKEYKPTQDQRIHWLSKAPGGSTVKFVYEDTYTVEYDRVKNVDAYIQKVLKNNTRGLITEIWINDTKEFEI